MFGILVVALALGGSVALALSARRSGSPWWPGALAAALILAGTGVAIVGGMVSESARGEQDWLGVGILIVLAGIGVMVYALIRLQRSR